MGTSPNAGQRRHTAICCRRPVQTVPLVTMQPIFLSSSSSPSANEPLMGQDNREASLSALAVSYAVNTTSVKRQIEFVALYRVPLALSLGNGSGTEFGASQCITMGPCRLTRRLTLGVFIPLS